MMSSLGKGYCRKLCCGHPVSSVSGMEQQEVWPKKSHQLLVQVALATEKLGGVGVLSLYSLCRL